MRKYSRLLPFCKALQAWQRSTSQAGVLFRPLGVDNRALEIKMTNDKSRITGDC